MESTIRRSRLRHTPGDTHTSSKPQGRGRDGTWHKSLDAKKIPFAPYVSHSQGMHYNPFSAESMAHREKEGRVPQVPIHTPSELEKSPTPTKKRDWKDITKDVARNINYAVTYNGQKDQSAKEMDGKQVHLATRIAAMAIPFIHFIIPETQLVTSTFKGIYQIAQYANVVKKDPTAKKVTFKDAIESPITRTALTIAVLVAGFFASKIALIVLSSLKVGLDIMDLRNSLLKDGFGKASILIMIKVAGSIAYLALSIFDSNLALVFSISAKLANNVFTAYCELQQGRWPEAIAALAFGALSNANNIISIHESIEDGTLTDKDTVPLSPQDQAGATNLSAVKKRKVDVLSYPTPAKKSGFEDDDDIETITLPTRAESYAAMSDTEKHTRDASFLDDQKRVSRRVRRSRR